jgi:hypothetical protein
VVLVERDGVELRVRAMRLMSTTMESACVDYHCIERKLFNNLRATTYIHTS